MCTTVLKNEINQVIDLLPDERVEWLLGIAQDMAIAAKMNQGHTADSWSDQHLEAQGVAAFEAMENLRQASPFPNSFDYGELRDAALKEKYASFA